MTEERRNVPGDPDLDTSMAAAMLGARRSGNVIDRALTENQAEMAKSPRQAVNALQRRLYWQLPVLESLILAKRQDVSQLEQALQSGKPQVTIMGGRLTAAFDNQIQYAREAVTSLEVRLSKSVFVQTRREMVETVDLRMRAAFSPYEKEKYEREKSLSVLVRDFAVMSRKWFNLRGKGFAAGTNINALREDYLDLSLRNSEFSPEERFRCWESFLMGLGPLKARLTKEERDVMVKFTSPVQGSKETIKFQAFMSALREERGITSRAVLFLVAYIDLENNNEMSESLKTFLLLPKNYFRILDQRRLVDLPQLVPVFDEWFVNERPKIT